MIKHELEKGINVGDLVWIRSGIDGKITGNLAMYLGQQIWDGNYEAAKVHLIKKNAIETRQTNLLVRVKDLVKEAVLYGN